VPIILPVRLRPRLSPRHSVNLLRACSKIKLKANFLVQLILFSAKMATDSKITDEQVAVIANAIKPKSGLPRPDIDFTVHYLESGAKVSTRERIVKGHLSIFLLYIHYVLSSTAVRVVNLERVHIQGAVEASQLMLIASCQG
jgi:hypothetical protein